MNRLALMVLRNVWRVPGVYGKLCHYAKHTDDYPELEKYQHIQYILRLALNSGNVDLQLRGKENIPQENGFMMYANHQGLFDVVALVATWERILAGVYKIEYSVANNTAVVTPVAKSFWLAGVVNGAGHWDCSSGIEFEMVNETTYRAYYTFTEADTDASWMIGFVGACKAVYGYAGWAADIWYGAVETQDNVTVESYGLYELVLTLNDAADFTAGGTVTATKLEGYFLVGTIGDGDTWRAESVNKIEVTGDTVSTQYTWTQKDEADWLGADQIAAVKIINVAADGAVVWYGNATNGDNVIIPEVGTYTITLADGVVSAAKQ